MKKLMTMLAAVGMAFGLFADEPATITPISSTSFEVSETPAPFDGDNLIVNLDGGKWACEDQDAKLTKGVYTEDDPAYAYQPKTVRYASLAAQANYLNVKTAFDKPLVRSLNAPVTDPVYFDQLVKFTAFEDPAEIDGDAKIALYVKEELDAEENPTATNLYVVAGQYVNGELSVATNNLGAIDVDAWHRVTIKAIKGFANTELAFEIFIDGDAQRLNAPAFDAASAASLPDSAKVINNARKLFPSLKKSSTTVVDVAFAGQGAIDDLMATTEAPGQWAEDKVVTLGWGENVTGFTYQIDGETAVQKTGLTEAGTLQIAYSTSFDVAISAVTCATDWIFDTVECTGCTYANDEIHFTGENQTATIKAKDNTPRVSVKIGEKTDTFPTFAAALASLSSMTATDVATVTLAENLTIGANEQGATEALLGSAGEVTLDLAGKSLTLASGATISTELVQTRCKKLTITDTIGGGSIGTTATGSIKIVMMASGDTALSIEGDNAFSFEGAVTIADGVDASISGGKFLASANTAPGSDPAAFKYAAKVDLNTCDITNDGTYWVVKAAEMVTVTFKVDGVQYGDVQTIKKGGTATKPATDPTKTGYTFKEWQKDDVAFDFGTAINENTTLDAAFDAITYTIKFVVGDGATSVADKELKYSDLPYTLRETSSKTGYSFTGWFDDNVEFDTQVTQVTTETFASSAEVTVYAGFETVNYSIVYKNADGTDFTTWAQDYEAPAFFTVLATENLPVAANVVVDGTFNGWTNALGVAVENTAGLTADLTVFADVTKAAPEPKPFDPEEDIPAAESADDINNDTTGTLKKKYLKAPGEVETTAQYVSYFDAVQAGEGKIRFELNEDGEQAVADSLAEQINPDEGAPALDPAKIADGTQTSMTVVNPIAGFYYAIRQAGALNDMKVTQCELATGKGDVGLTLNKGATAGFYQIQCSPTEIKVENAD